MKMRRNVNMYPKRDSNRVSNPNPRERASKQERKHRPARDRPGWPGSKAKALQYNKISCRQRRTRRGRKLDGVVKDL